MKRTSLAALILALAPTALIAQAPEHHGDAMPMKAPVPPSKSLTINFVTAPTETSSPRYWLSFASLPCGTSGAVPFRLYG